ncbi:MAG TPA: methyltransferase domain-containing protein [Azospira sp.]|nr:methyltransferase domain-containing protein [Azospira sp.]
MDQAAAPLVDCRQVRRAYTRAAGGYDGAAFVAREVGGRMAERLDYVRLEPKRILDLGCGTGADLAHLQARYPEALTIGADAVPAMLAEARRKHPASGPLVSRLPAWLGGGAKGPALAGAEALHLPFAGGAFSLLWSNLMLHWVNDPEPVLKELHRTLEVGGLLMFSTFGPDTLKELRAAFGDGYAHTQRFIDMHDWGDLLVHCGFADPVMDMEVLTLTYPDFDALAAELKAAGDTCAMTARRTGLMTPRQWRRAAEVFAAKARDGRVPVTLEVVYGHAWKTAPKKTADGRSIVHFERAKPGLK